MTSTLLPNVGDKISSPQFAYGYKIETLLFGEPCSAIHVDGVTKNMVATESYSEEARIAFALKYRTPPPKDHQVDFGNYSADRGSDVFVVEKTEMINTDIHGSHPPELQVYARKIFPSGLYDPKGELIVFHCGADHSSIKVKNISFHGHMQRVFI